MAFYEVHFEGASIQDCGSSAALVERGPVRDIQSIMA